MVCTITSTYITKHASTFRFPLFITACFAIVIFIGGCSSNSKKGKKPPKVKLEKDHSFGRAFAVGHVDNNIVDEASGLVAYRGHTNYFWTHNDSWDDAQIFLFQRNGHIQAEYYLQEASNRDWEDIAAGPGPQPNTNYLYIGDIGDNYTLYSHYVIYRIEQPSIPANSGKEPLIKTVTDVEKLYFVYPDGSHDAETLFIDPWTRDLYIVTKQKTQDRVYRYPYPQSTTKVDTVEFVCKLPVNQLTGGDLSPDGQTLLLKSLSKVFIWRRKSHESISDMLTEKPKQVVPYGTGPQEEAIAFGSKGKGYYTLSESKGKGKAVTLHFHTAKSKNKK